MDVERKGIQSYQVQLCVRFAILRFAKYKGPEIGHIEAHNERMKENYASNQD